MIIPRCNVITWIESKRKIIKYNLLMMLILYALIAVICSASALNIASDDYDGDNFVNRIRDTEDAIKDAAEYIQSERHSNGNWGSFTPRAIIALAFAGRASAITNKEMEILRKQLNIQLVFKLMQSKITMSDSTLALYINALLATCQNPRNFEGMDLVARLRENTNAAKMTNSTLPLPMLTLCLADDIKDKETMVDDGNTLVKIYNEIRKPSMLGLEALAVMGMICYSRKDRRDYSPHLNPFFKKYGPELYNMDIYNKALLMQAFIARGVPVDIKKLLADQERDGSFKDILATYYSIPVLMKSSLLELKCNNYTNTGVRSGNLMMEDGAKQNVILSLWISGLTKDIRSHSLTLSFDGSKSLQDILLMAAARDPLFKFRFGKADVGNIVYKLANVSNDIENGKSWQLYVGKIGKVTLNSDKNLRSETHGIDSITATTGHHFVFWFKRD